jgi:hypothetical protein
VGNSVDERPEEGQQISKHFFLEFFYVVKFNSGVWGGGGQ